MKAELDELASRRTWRLFAGAIALALSLLIPAVAWVLGVLSTFETIGNTANPTPEQLNSSLLSGGKWGLGLGAVCFVSGLVLLGMGISCDLRLKRVRCELEAI
ncbi:MAG: hypothetical protein FJ298_10050 [Planctomycetes bacterium]|nr:hypothetical protein [Planctomycetota bacterium]